MARFAPLKLALLASGEGLLAVPCVLAATGLLYLLRPDVPGPEIGDALPLDELPRRAGVSIVLFAVIWGGVGVWSAFGLGRRGGWRLVAFAGALLFWEFLATTISLAVVRQERVLAAAFAALTVPAVYLAPLVVVTAAVWSARLVSRSHGRLESPTFSAR